MTKAIIMKDTNEIVSYGTCNIIKDKIVKCGKNFYNKDIVNLVDLDDDVKFDFEIYSYFYKDNKIVKNSKVIEDKQEDKKELTEMDELKQQLEVLIITSLKQQNQINEYREQIDALTIATLGGVR